MGMRSMLSDGDSELFSCMTAGLVRKWHRHSGTP
jgi:predicted DNA-binding transcriptional regulator AlpA